MNLLETLNIDKLAASSTPKKTAVDILGDCFLNDPIAEQDSPDKSMTLPAACLEMDAGQRNLQSPPAGRFAIDERTLHVGIHNCILQQDHQNFTFPKG